jgi:hypothetical protein
MEQLIELHGKPKALNSADGALWTRVDWRDFLYFFCTA